jgi:hypothetical protein
MPESLDKNPILIGLGDTGAWHTVEHSGILTTTVLPISQVFFMSPEQQFGAVSVEIPTAECEWTFAISWAHSAAQSE